MKELLDLIAEFRADYLNAPLYGGYSRTLKRKIPAKSQVQAAFIDDLLILQKTSAVLDDGVEVSAKIDEILKSFE